MTYYLEIGTSLRRTEKGGKCSHGMDWQQNI